MREALFYSSLDTGAVRCFLCPHYCVIREGGRGKCSVRENIAGTLQSLVYGKVLTTSMDPIEKKPLYHFLPGTATYSLATAGCNLSCGFCQNWEISQSPRLESSILGRDMTPAEIVADAVSRRCPSISYTYTEPTIFLEFALDIMHEARENNVKNVFVSNGFITPEAIGAVSPMLDAINIDLKGFTDEFYREVCGARLGPVLDAIELYRELGVWLELTTLIVPGHNDSDDMLARMAEFIASLDTSIPWHISRFHPDYRMLDTPPTGVDAIRRTVEAGKRAGLKYIYAGAVPGGDNESTFCPNCGSRVIVRTGFSTTEMHLDGDRCETCGEPIDLVLPAGNV